ncbi:helix-turn-helix domain-containing protein [Corynebacterium argentoratense]|uniref:helix-turn-helix domain-containing protein n=1 Tax=Corynebacterium argentoratense TaxID=42817 RepID=UPI00242B08C1|nr:helix-turn-helix transcriptional regulator [Corynebacterium argentoratense]
MSPSLRAKTPPPSAATAATLRKNLRSAREAQGLTRDQAIARIEQPTITTTALGKVETGDRNIAAPELAQLAVAYQIPIQCFFLPWTGDDSPRPILSGADFRTGNEIIEDWLLHNRYPSYPDAITRTGSAVQGAINARLFTNPKALLALNENPTPKKYSELALAELDNLLQPLKQEVAAYVSSATELCGLDPFPSLEASHQSNEHSSKRPSLIDKLATTVTRNPTRQLSNLEKLHRSASELASSYSSSYATDCAYSTVEALWSLPDDLHQITEPLQHHQTLISAVKLAHKTNKQK